MNELFINRLEKICRDRFAKTLSQCNIETRLIHITQEITEVNECQNAYIFIINDSIEGTTARAKIIFEGQNEFLFIPAKEFNENFQIYTFRKYLKIYVVNNYRKKFASFYLNLLILRYE